MLVVPSHWKARDLCTMLPPAARRVACSTS